MPRLSAYARFSAYACEVLRQRQHRHKYKRKEYGAETKIFKSV